jgi:hypothetical protein
MPSDNSYTGKILDVKGSKGIQNAMVIATWPIDKGFFHGSYPAGDYKQLVAFTDNKGNFSIPWWFEFDAFEGGLTKPFFLIHKEGYFPVLLVHNWYYSEGARGWKGGDNFITGDSLAVSLVRLSPDQDRVKKSAFVLHSEIPRLLHGRNKDGRSVCDWGLVQTLIKTEQALATLLTDEVAIANLKKSHPYTDMATYIQKDPAKFGDCVPIN